MTEEATTEQKRPKAPPVDVSKLSIQTGTPTDIKRPADRTSSWNPLLKQIKKGQFVFVEGRTAQSLAYVRGLGKDLGKEITLRSGVNDAGVAGAFVCCVKDGEEEPQAPAEGSSEGASTSESSNDGL